MEAAIQEILDAIRAGDRTLDARWLDKLVRRHNRATHDGRRTVAKRRLLPYYLGVKANDPERWASWNVDPATEETLLRLLKMKPRRTASGVATITVITKPWPCSSDCLYCPNDVRMPKSYLADEPACQRAERNYFDPYLQVRSRLAALKEMGHVTDKVELIVLGGTWNDYPQAYQVWYVCELFRALNEGTTGVSDQAPAYARAMGAAAEERDRFYRSHGLTYNRDELVRRTSDLQERVDAGLCTYNQAVCELERQGWSSVATLQSATLTDLEQLHRVNETAAHRVVGLTIETRPDLMDLDQARAMRRLGCTKIQMGIQSLDQDTLRANGRNVSIEQIARAFEALRLCGFKIQAHMMANLLGMTPDDDRQDYLRLVRDPRFLPDEIKLYPCCLVQSARLSAEYERGTWRPYTEEELIDLLADDLLATPAYVRISRMIRDISATDIVVGNKKTNLRQLVEARVAQGGRRVDEIRQREVSTANVSPGDLRLEHMDYATTVSDERFYQWTTESGKIAGFLRLSLPAHGDEAMIREVHVYGRVARIHQTEHGGAQHAGLGRRMVEEACAYARDRGYAAINVISSVGTRNYYRSLGFGDADLYQRRVL
ncbi:MAG: tRNA uridine(34) 5-carboxymethylaminomethyl modification radical SAM/GNAT enzyme Elp3 [Coriobacteriales bacterium]|nr:tRNA uridine(34) 5-carboxymethylaminomethyl modification radical SAM/GNAT enzyme Elp3 [Coriobacteriales bacterium]